MNQKTVFKFIKSNLLLIILIILFAFFFFFRLDYLTLTSWDEGWYASISREMVKTGDFINMIWNGRPYYDHPPIGFWLMAVSYKIFGINELATRLPSAIMGLLSIILIYKVGVELFDKKVIGFVAALIMGTSVWYTIRVRSGNLESVFVFFYILAIYLSVKSSKNFKWFPAAMAAFGGLILSKTLVGFSAIIPILFINFNQLIKLKKNFIYLVLGAAALILVAYPWYYIHIQKYPRFLEEHFLNIGARNKTLSSFFQLNPVLPLFYLHMGVRKWYYLWILGLGFLTVSFKFIKKNVFFLLLWNAVILYPFLTTDKTHIWHLIPVYLPMSLITAAGIYYLGELGVKILKKIKPVKKLLKPYLVSLFYLISFMVMAYIQIKIFYKEVIPASRYIPDDVDISKRAGKYNKPVYLDDDFLPIAVFYTGKNPIPLISLPDEKKTMVKFFQSDEKDFIMITRNWAVNNLDVENVPYEILENNNSFSIVTKP